MGTRTSYSGISTRTGTFTGGGIVTQPAAPTTASRTAGGTTATPGSAAGTTRTGPSGGRPGTVLNLDAGTTNLIREQQSRLAPLPVKIQQVARQNLLKNIYIDVKTTGQVRILNSQFIPITNVGLSDLRPEILSLVNFLPIWERSSERTNNVDMIQRNNSVAGNFLNFQYQTKSLRQETLTTLIKNIKSAANQDPFVDIINEYNLQMQDVERTLNIIDNVYQNISVIKNSLEIKKIPRQAFEIVENSVPTQIPSIEDYFATRMNYGTDKYNIFSETKIMMQLIFDLSNMMQNYSVSLVSDIDNDRASDISPTIIDTTYGIGNSYTFNINNLGNTDSVIKANDETYFNNFMSSLPVDPDKRITLLTYMLAKEYLVSNGLGDDKNLDLLASFNINRDNVVDLFFNILGRPGADIFDPPTSRAISTTANNITKLSSLMYIDPNVANTRVLTLENKYIDYVAGDSTKNVVYVPGASYFTDAIIAVAGTAWNTKPYTDFTTQFNTTITKTLTLVKSLLKLDVFDRAGNVVLNTSTRTQPSYISPSSLNSKIIQSLYSSYDNLTTQEESFLSSASTNRSLYLRLLDLQKQKTQKTRELSDAIRGGATPTSPFCEGIRREISALEEQIAAIDLPIVSNNIKVLFDQSVLAAIFKLASAATTNIKLKRYLYQYCVLAAFCTNKFYVGTNIFSLLANSEFKLASDVIPELVFVDEFGVSSTTANGNVQCIDGQGLSTGPLQEAIRNMVTEILGSVTTGQRPVVGNTILEFNLTPEELTEILTNCALGNGPSANDNMVAYFIKLANELFNSSQINGVNVQLDSLNRTRYNSLSLSTQLLLLFEIICQYANTYSAWEFRTFNRELNLLSIKLDYQKNTAVQTAFQSILNSVPETEKENLRSANVYYKNLESNATRIAEEYTAIRNGLGIWQVVNNQIQLAAGTITNFFNQKEMQEFLKTSNPQVLGLLQNSSQARLASYLYRDIKERGAATESLVFNNGGTQADSTDKKEKELIISNTVIPSEYNALKSLFSTQLDNNLITYPTNNVNADTIKRTNKIVTIGMPTGMTRHLTDRVSFSNNQQAATLDLQNKQSDVVSVNVYPADLRFEEIIFKPYRYIFDLSLFITKKNILDLNATNVENYSSLIDRINITDFEDIYNPRALSFNDIKNDSRYSFLSNEQKRQMLANHLTSYLLDLYINLLTGTRVSEETFLSPSSNKKLTEKTFTAIKNYIRQLGEEPPLRYDTTEIILADPVLSQNVKDMIRLMTYGSLVFNQEEVKKLVTTPKLFERVVNIPINLDYMEVDLVATLATPAGQASVANILTREDLRSAFELRDLGDGVRRPFLIPNNPDSFIMKTVMIAIETVATSRQQPAQRSSPNVTANRLTNGG